MSQPSNFGSNFSQKPESQQLQLVVHAGPLAGKGFPITGNVLTFGRDPDNDITLDDTQVSRNHARLMRQGDEVILEDLDSTNGTLVNGKPIVGQQVLQPADIISIGSSVFGVKGFSAPHTIGITQISSERPPFSIRQGPKPAAPSPARPGPAPSPARPGPAPRQPAPKEGWSNVNLLAIGGILALVVIVLAIAATSAYLLSRGRGSALADAPVVVITAPVAGSDVQVNQPVTVQTTASAPSGVKRIELWVSGVKTSEATSPVAQGQPTLTASFQWTPQVPGTYTLEIRAFNVNEVASAPTVVTVNAVGDTPAGSDTPTPTFTPTPFTPTPTVPNTPSLTTLTDLNVRAGPGTDYDLLGLLPSGSSVEVVGRDETRQWWQIRFAPSPNQLGWVVSDPAYSRTSGVENVPVAQPPATPTPTPSNTPVPATFTPTPVETEKPTPTPTSTPTATPPATSEIEFDVSPTSIQGGECVQVSWNVSGVREVYFEGEGVGGSDSFTDCPNDTKSYEFRVIRLDGSVYEEEIRVEVINPISSTGTRTLDRNQSIDLDSGDAPGDDFVWIVEDGNRRFETLGGVLLAPMRDVSSLRNLTLAECAAANFGEYNFIDASDSRIGGVNELVDGRSACYRTNTGRLGKLRFPNFSSGSLRIEWLTWK